jgi:hypothetical protein
MLMEIEEFKETQIEQKESIKLIKNTKGYNWEIRLLEINIDRLEQLNNEMISKFNGGEK